MPLIDRTRPRQGFFTRDAFAYDPGANAYRCPGGKVLLHVNTVRWTQVMTCRRDRADCAPCALKPQCPASNRRTVTRLGAEDVRAQVRTLVGTRPLP